jgi:cyclopropane fatty-acyl-phospholipid synthase-like methyltransferase
MPRLVVSAEHRLRDEYRATVAQWKAQTVAQPPKAAKLAANPRLKEYVQTLMALSESPQGCSSKFHTRGGGEVSA